MNNRTTLGHADLTRTVAALAAFDAAHESHDSDPDCLLAKAVGIAFGFDTADRNQFANCAALVRPGAREPRGGKSELSFVRLMVREFQRRQGV